MIQNEDRFRFDDSDLALFSAASGDRNPLHLSLAYAARTSYGAQVVFGALGAVAALGGVSLEDSRRVHGMTVDFLRPMFLGVEYQIQVTPQDNGLLARLFDGTSTVVSVMLKLGAPWPGEAAHANERGLFPRQEAAARDSSELVKGLSVTGQYRTEQSAQAALRKQWRVTIPAPLVDVLLWSSYLVGMEMPGKTALFSKFSVELTGEPHAAGAFDYEAHIEHVDNRLGQMRIRASLRWADGATAAVECRAFNRPGTPSFDPQLLATELPPSDALAGKRALVIGASRGLGAALVHALASQGATVIAVARSEGVGATTGIECIRGDATDLKWRQELREKIVSEHGGLDLLIVNAFPPLLPLLLEENSSGRIESYLERAMAMTVGPLCSFLPALSVARGSAVLISSMAVEQPVKEWPHYVAAKRAAEALAEVTALQYPEVGMLVVRPERLLTEMTNTPLGRRGALAPEVMAARIVKRIEEGISGLQTMRS